MLGHMKTKCPTCRKMIEYSRLNPHRPFCSERCKVLDLGAWAEEKYRVPVSEQEKPSVKKNPEEPPGEDLLN